MTAPVRVTLGSQPFRTNIDVRQHSLVSDEPGDHGGSDTGATPQEMLLASLAACKAITAKMYADRKQWPLETITIDAAYDDPEPSTTGGAPTQRIVCTVSMTGPLDDEQRERIRAISEKCPVHKTLTGPVVIESRLVDG